MIDSDNFPTDRYLLEGIATELGLSLKWIRTDRASGLTPGLVADAVSDQTALLVASHVAYRSGFLADAAAITGLVHAAGGRVLWDLSHSVGSVPIAPGRLAGRLRRRLRVQVSERRPGGASLRLRSTRSPGRGAAADPGLDGPCQPFAMGPGYQPAQGIRGFLTGTPPILAMVPLRAGIELLAEAGIEKVRAKSLLLTDFTLELIDDWLVPLGVRLASPREPERRGGHLTIRRAGLEQVNSSSGSGA